MHGRPGVTAPGRPRGRTHELPTTPVSSPRARSTRCESRMGHRPGTPSPRMAGRPLPHRSPTGSYRCRSSDGTFAVPCSSPCREDPCRPIAATLQVRSPASSRPRDVKPARGSRPGAPGSASPAHQQVSTVTQQKSPRGGYGYRINLLRAGLLVHRRARWPRDPGFFLLWRSQALPFPTDAPRGSSESLWLVSGPTVAPAE